MPQLDGQSESSLEAASRGQPSAWFAGPKAENGDWFAGVVERIISDYHAWRRNYFPEDGVVVDCAAKRESEPFRDRFEDRLIELLARLKHDVPFHSPRYAGHMVAEQTLPAIAGYLAAMLYNPNNVSPDAAPVTVRLELEAAGMIARMLGHPEDGWAHLTGGGTVANLEALWLARAAKYMPLAVAEARCSLDLSGGDDVESAAGRRRLLAMSPQDALNTHANLFSDASKRWGPGAATGERVQRGLVESRFHLSERGLPAVLRAIGSSPVVLVPETHHYSFEKIMDVLGLGRDSLVSVRVDAGFRMRPDDLERRLDEVGTDGRHVLAVVAVVGTTEEGAVDPVDQIVAIRDRRALEGHGSFWVHADAAYGGYLRTLTRPGRVGLGPASATVRVAGTERTVELQLPQQQACLALEHLGECDSITIDPHKLGYIPYPAGCVSFRSSLVKPLARQHAPYLSDPEGAANKKDDETIGLYMIEGSKPGAAAAAVWLSHTLIPLDSNGHGALVRQTIRNACELHALLEEYPKLLLEAGREAPAVRAVCLCPPGSNIVCYAFAPSGARSGASLEQINAVNEAVHRRFSVEAGRRVYDQSFFVSKTVLSSCRYDAQTISGFLERLGANASDYPANGVFLLRSVLMNPWYEQAKGRGRYFLSELVAELYAAASQEMAAVLAASAPASAASR
jgi:glutamate/tyrosine decarboxylase-like PLP-dependent enzyme